jgi:hypothetical protein
MIRIPTTSRRASGWLVAVALAGLLCSCKSDDDGGEDNVIGPESQNVTSLDDAVLAEMSAAIEQAIGLLFVGGGTVAGGGGGQIVVEGNIFRFEEYSSDGLFYVDGELVMDLLASPITVKGDLAFRDGEREGPIVVDVTIDLSTSPVSYGGTITVDREAIDVASFE